MVEVSNWDYGIRAAQGRYIVGTVNKFGRTINADSGVATDVHDQADDTATDVPVWLAPTTARIHTLVSSSATDDAASTGLKTVKVSYLADWDTAEASETVTMDGTDGVAMSNAAVIIHRIKPLTWGTSGVNVGKITATAASDGTITAQINVGQGQTQMAVYGVPSIYTLYLESLYAYFNKAGGNTAAVDISLLVNPIPGTVTTKYVVKHTMGLFATGTSGARHVFSPPKKIDGPAIVKVQALPGANDLDISAGFDGYLVKN